MDRNIDRYLDVYHRALAAARARVSEIPLSRRERVPGGRVRGAASDDATSLADRLDTPNRPSIMLPTPTP